MEYYVLEEPKQVFLIKVDWTKIFGLCIDIDFENTGEKNGKYRKTKNN